MQNLNPHNQTTTTKTDMKMFVDIKKIYLYRDPVDFRKAIDGLALIVEQEMDLSPFDSGATRGNSLQKVAKVAMPGCLGIMFRF